MPTDSDEDINKLQEYFDKCLEAYSITIPDDKSFVKQLDIMFVENEKYLVCTAIKGAECASLYNTTLYLYKIKEDP